ncbi:glycosyltransferase family 2 protein [Hyphomonas johnsonii]|uniref:Putative glycosyl transferase ExoA n=1 Tax=Hyphomonas johnsonii MHS-2 TaxID=1280950 RepID=A0A059FVM1_9PROT|nr:glycosyltransferase family 2 protein [Hyphomonas johnsonii]KCZ94493.1 putative glycosyl transferase ExoA [Hyphomonas johnsonii MHS-2]
MTAQQTQSSERPVSPDEILAVVPVLNEARYIEACIRSLMTGANRLQDVALTIVDGGSTDDTVAIVQRLQAEFPNLRLAHNPKRLQAAAVNLAVVQFADAKTRFMVRCDAHSVFPPDFILDVVSALARTKASSVVIPMDAVGATCFEKANAWIVDTPLGSGGSAHRGGRKSGFVDHGHHAGFDLATFRAVGGYDETFSHNEDAEYDERVIQQGGKIFLDATIRKAYHPRGTISSLARQYFNYGKGRARNAFKHKRPLKVRQALPILAFLGSVLGLVVSPFFWPALILPAGYVSILLLASIFIAISKRSPCGLLSGVASGTMHMSWAVGFLVQASRQWR